MTTAPGGAGSPHGTAGHPAGPPVFIYYDYTCPFSYIAEGRFEQLRMERPMRARWRPLERYPGLPEGGVPLAELEPSEAVLGDMRLSLGRMATDAGIPFELPAFVPDSSGALQAAEFAYDVGTDVFLNLHRALFRAYFAFGVNLGDREALLSVAEGAGVDRDGLAAALEDGRYAEELRTASAEAERYGIDSTPVFLFGRFKVVGAAPLRVLRETAERAATEAAAGTEAGANDAAGG